FSLKQEGFCGDGVCGDGEDASSCTVDCSCNNGDSRPCSANHYGRCALGNETCINGEWSGCSAPITETCNQVDDDCDGIIDNVNGGDSVEATQCACYGGERPESRETFDGIDNDCNGEVDDGCVCEEGETEECGSNIGECQPGTRTCTNCQWGGCQGTVGPFDEVCGNGKDDDCDGQTDEADCLLETNETCAYGAIPSTGCKCGASTYASGYCCGGVYSMEPCPGFPWWIIVVIGVAVLAVGVVFWFMQKKKVQENSWEELEKKYTPSEMLVFLETL
ncbi:MAG: hypothetical protein DRO99_05100, partial [Candidatus Aenigmatarchaeota archaeon]